MSALEDALLTFLSTDAPLMALLDGGLITFDQTKRNGIGLQDTPQLFNDFGFLKACLEIKETPDRPWGGIRDRTAKAKSTMTPVELWFLQDGDAGYVTLEAAKDRVRFLLDDVIIPGVGTAAWIPGGLRTKDSSLDNASVVRDDYGIVRLRTWG